MTQDRRTRWLPVLIAALAMVPAAFLAGIVLFSTCFVERDGTGDPAPRVILCEAGGGNVLPLVTMVVAGAILFALVRAVRRGAGGPRVWLLAALPAVSLVLVPLLAGLLPPT